MLSCQHLVFQFLWYAFIVYSLTLIVWIGKPPNDNQNAKTHLWSFHWCWDSAIEWGKGCSGCCRPYWRRFCLHGSVLFLAACLHLLVIGFWLILCDISDKPNYIHQIVTAHMPKFLYMYMFLCVCMCIQVAGAAVIFEVQRSAKAEARKEELRKQQLEVMWPCGGSLYQLYLISVNWLP